ncbi:MAG: aminofutalosine synthase MqnE [Bacteroidetes bacterium RIFCSPLOWO2_02_FULL_36_8]|nr:MAG: aminofutalosine synthase MqnE [Bacteroidetes bacterium RIFCSPLOWO2_02_FULL_36_8]OFY70828.1 MAG: aminofutalosine synthase MqnE [Bacteroidetes bacterium RIFCSPLOWO2_12_FULL_37_12]
MLSETFIDSNLIKSVANAELKSIGAKIFNSQRISPEEGILLYQKAEIGFLAVLANFVREKLHGKKTFFNTNFHIEPTNVCVFTCDFCSYSRLPKEDGWEKSPEEIENIVKSYSGKHVTEVHIVGGVHPKRGLQYYGELIQRIKKIRPEIHVKAYTAVELEYIFRKAKVGIKEGLEILRNYGLDSIPGGGAEIFDETIREKICADKVSSQGWLEIHETAHQSGIPSNATMLYGHIEEYQHRIDHLERLRNLQDKTHGFNAFIPLKFRNQDNAMSHLSEVTLLEDLRNYAVSRIYLDNFKHIKAYWPMIGKQTTALSLSFGVDDIDGTVDDSTKIYSMAGAEDQHPVMTTSEIVELIQRAGKIPVERSSLYEELRVF